MADPILRGIVRLSDGTGFVLTEDGLIATCAHVVKGAHVGSEVEIAFHVTDKIATARIEILRGAEDVAILRPDTPLPEAVTRVPLGSSVGTKGRIFDTFGFPEAKPIEGMAGKCEVIGETTERGFRVLQLRASEITAGYSGAPVWDAQLQAVIGMVTSVAVQDELGKQSETAFIIPIETLREVCPTLRLSAECPYRGLQVFEREHADLYFGRETATRELLDALSRRDFVALVGVSGSGKSSLVRAGLEKGLREHAIPGLIDRIRCLTVPGRNPLLNLVLSLTETAGVLATDVIEAFDLLGNALAEEKRSQTTEILNARTPQTLDEALRACVTSEGILLIVDQFERLYTECDDDAVRQHFIDTLLAASGDSVKVLLALRADYYGLALEHPGLEQVVKQDGQVTLGRMTAADLRAVIEQPAQARGRTLEPELTERLIADVHERAGDLPLLEFALTELWERDSQTGVLTLQTYAALGYEAPDGQKFPGVRGAIAQRAETLWQELNEQERRAARRVFLNLVTPGPLDKQGERTAEDASRRAWQVEWDVTTRRVVRKLVDARLLTTGQDPASDQPTVEVAHEALIRAWPRLQRWLEDYRPFIRWYNAELAPFLRRWLDKEQQPDFLLPEAMLVQAQHWLDRYPDELAGPPEEFIRASLERREREQAAAERRRRQLTMAALGAAVVFLILALLAWGQRNAAQYAKATAVAEAQERATAQTDAERRRLEAEASQATAVTEAHMRATAQIQAEHSQATAVTEAKIRSTAQAQANHSQATAVVESEIRLTAQARAEQEEGIARSIILAVRAQSLLERYPQRSILLALEALNYAKEIESSKSNVYTTEQILRNILNKVGGSGFSDHEGEIIATAFGPNGSWLATSSANKTVRLWNLKESGIVNEPLILRGHEKAVTNLVFSSNGRWLATSSQSDDTVYLWDLTTFDSSIDSFALGGHKEGVKKVTFSPNGRWLTTIGCGGSGPLFSTCVGGIVQLWDLSDHDPTSASLNLYNQKGWVETLAFGPEGHWLAAAGCGTKGGIFSPCAAGTVWLWNMDNGDPVTEPFILSGHEKSIHTLAFGPDGHRLATGSADRTVRLWNLQMRESDSQPLVLRGHQADVRSVAFGRNGNQLITGSDDGTIRLWGPQVYDDITKSIILSPGEGYQAKSLDVGPGGRWLSISSADGHPSFSRSNAYDIPQLWDLDLINADPSREPFILHGHEDLVFATAFSSDGQWFATGGYDNTVRLWNLQDADPSVNPAVLHGHEAPITTLAFSPDGRWLITGSKDRTTRLWDLKLSNQTNFAAEPLVLRSHVGDVETVAFSPNTQWLAIGGESFNVQLNKTKQIFSIDEELFLYDHTDAVYDVAFGPDSNWLATGGADGTARLWDMQSITSSDAIRSITYTHEDSVYAVAFGPDGNWLATGTADNVVRLWNIKADKYDIKSLALRGHKDSVRALAFGPDGRWLASGSADDTVRLWDLKPTGPTEPMILDSHEETVYAVALSPNGHWLATGSADNTALLWDIKTLTNSYQETYYPTDDPLVLRNYEQEIKALAFSKPDGRWLATASGNIIRLWHLTGGKPSPTPLTLYGYGEQVESIAFSQEGHWLAAGSGGEVWIWHLGVDDLINLACRTAGRNFTLQEWQEYFPDQRYHATCADLPAPANTGN